MDLHPITKFAVVYLDTIADTTEILKVFSDARDALSFLTDYIDNHEDYQDENWIRKQYENSRVVSVFSCHWVSTKTLVARYFVLPFEDVMK